LQALRMRTERGACHSEDLSELRVHSKKGRTSSWPPVPARNRWKSVGLNKGAPRPGGKKDGPRGSLTEQRGERPCRNIRQRFERWGVLFRAGTALPCGMCRCLGAARSLCRKPSACRRARFGQCRCGTARRSLGVGNAVPSRDCISFRGRDEVMGRSGKPDAPGDPAPPRFGSDDASKLRLTRLVELNLSGWREPEYGSTGPYQIRRNRRFATSTKNRLWHLSDVPTGSEIVR